jgi:DNA mismatch repair ATPase MutS
VVRVITPGTLIDESFLNPYENNYLLAIDCTTPDGPLGLAWIDVSTGEFFSNSSTYEGFRDELARISPREIVLDKTMEVSASHPIRKAILEEGTLISYAVPSDTELPVPAIVPYDHSDDLVPPADAPSPTFEPCETSAIKLLTSFLRANLLERMPVLSSPCKEMSDGRMQIDSHTIKALEIRESMIEGGTSGSLLSVIKRTKTTGGTRLLARWLCKSPVVPSAQC